MRAKAVELLALYALKYPTAIYNGGVDDQQSMIDDQKIGQT